MKITHVLLGKADPELMGGINKVVHNLATEQIKLGHEVRVFGIAEDYQTIKHHHIYELSLFPKKNQRFLIHKSLKKAVKQSSDDWVFHLHSSFRPEIYLVSRILKKYNFRWVHTPHGGYTDVSLRKNYLFKKIYFYFFEKRIVNGALAIQSLGEKVNVGKENSKKIERVPNGFELSRNYKDKYTSKGLLNICFCGRVEKHYKGLDKLFHAIEIISKKDVRLMLNVIGDGPDLEYFTNYCITKKLDHIVNFLGAKFGQEKIGLILKNDLFILTSRSEGLPTGVLEAASLGLPLLVSQETNLGSYILSCSSGYVLDSNNPNEIAQEIIKAVNDKSSGVLEFFGSNARKMIVEHFNWHKIAVQMDKKIYSMAYSKNS